MRVLITGAAGLIGGVLREGLTGHELRGIDARPVEGFDSSIGDVSDFSSIRPAFEGADAVIHLAADPSSSAPWDRVIGNNIIGTYNVFEAAKQAGVGRIVFASSNHVTGMYERDHPYSAIVAGRYEGLEPGAFQRVDHRMPIRPDGYYGVAKQYGESLGRYYFEEYGIEFACLRIGSFVRGNSPLGSIRAFATWCSYGDLSQLVQKSLDAESLGFEIFYGVSGNTWRFWDIDHARQRVGYEPKDNAETYRTQFNAAS